MTQIDEQDEVSKILSKFEEDSKGLSLNEKIELIIERKNDKPENEKNYGLSDEDTYLHWYYINLRKLKINEGLRDVLKGLTYEEATMELKYLRDDLEREALKSKL